MTWQLITADCIEAMRGMNEASVDAIIGDAPLFAAGSEVIAETNSS